MNIRQAKEEIRSALRIYHRKNESGMYRYPVARQRPILLMGPPGVGKTAVMEQIAQEEGVGFVSYSMTHHTRQSAIGLPEIVHEEYEGESADLTRYTMSEIVASVYDCMKQTGYREGILFLDEINCVSETLTPVMLQLLQTKRFGAHAVPEGWMIVAAGNPHRYNRSARDFDIVTLDRVRLVEVEPDADTWLAYAEETGVHGAILSYLQLRKERFYEVIDPGTRDQRFVTARGWEDLSWYLQGAQELNIPVGAEQIGQFLSDPGAAADFAAYLQIYEHYGEDFRVREILEGEVEDGGDSVGDASDDAASGAAGPGVTVAGTAWETAVTRAREAAFEERFTVQQQFLAGIRQSAMKCAAKRESLKTLRGKMDNLRLFLLTSGDDLVSDVDRAEEFIQKEREALRVRKKNDLLGNGEEEQILLALAALTQLCTRARDQHAFDRDSIEKESRALLAERTAELKQCEEAALARMERALHFSEEAFGPEKETILLVSGLARTRETAMLLTEYPSERFARLVGGLAEG